MMDAIDQVLLDAYEWQQDYRPGLDYGKSEPACRDFRISRQWMDYDDLNAEVEWNLKAATGKIVEPLIQALDMRHRLAINTAMRNFINGSQVWINPRYPETQEEDYARAKAILCPQLVAANLIDKETCKPAEFAL